MSVAAASLLLTQRRNLKSTSRQFRCEIEVPIYTWEICNKKGEYQNYIFYNIRSVYILCRARRRAWRSLIDKRGQDWNTFASLASNRGKTTMIIATFGSLFWSMMKLIHSNSIARDGGSKIVKTEECCILWDSIIGKPCFVHIHFPAAAKFDHIHNFLQEKFNAVFYKIILLLERGKGTCVCQIFHLLLSSQTRWFLFSSSPCHSWCLQIGTQHHLAMRHSSPSQETKNYKQLQPKNRI